MQLVIGGKTWKLDDSMGEDQLKAFYDEVMNHDVKVDAVQEPVTAPVDDSQPAYRRMTIDADELKSRDAPIDIKYGAPVDYSHVTTTANDINKLYKSEFGANPNLFTLPEKVRGIQSKKQGLYDIASNTSGMDAFNIFAGQETTKLGIGAKGVFGDNIFDLRNFEHERTLTDPLAAEHPIAHVAGSMLPYIPMSIGQGWALEAGSKLGSIPAVMSKYRAARNLSPQLFAAGEAVAENPIAQNALFGAIVGGVDPYDTATSGAINSAASTALLGKVFGNAERYQNFNTSSDDAVIDWARKKGFYVSSGTAVDDPVLQMEENAFSGFRETARTAKNIATKNRATTARVILGDIFSQNGDELNAKTISAVDKAVGSELDTAVSGITGNGKILRDKLDEALKYAVGGRNGGKNYGTELKLVDSADYAKFGKLYDKINDLVGPGYVTGEKYQKIERWLREFKQSADNNPAYKSELTGLYNMIDEGLDDAVKSNMSSKQIELYDLAKTKYATKELIKRHLDQGEINWGGLHEEMRAFNPTRYALNNAPEGSPMHELQNLLALHRLESKKAGLGITQEMSDYAKNAGTLKTLSVDMRLRGVDPKLYAPFGFKNAQRLAGAPGSSNSQTGGYNNYAIDFGKKMWDIVNDEDTRPSKVPSMILDKMENLLDVGYRP